MMMMMEKEGGKLGNDRKAKDDKETNKEVVCCICFSITYSSFSSQFKDSYIIYKIRNAQPWECCGKILKNVRY